MALGLTTQVGVKYGEKGIGFNIDGGLKLELSEKFAISLQYSGDPVQNEHGAKLKLEPLSWLHPYFAVRIKSDGVTTTNTTTSTVDVGIGSNPFNVSSSSTSNGPSVAILAGAEIFLQIIPKWLGVFLALEVGFGTGFSYSVYGGLRLDIPFGGSGKTSSGQTSQAPHSSDVTRRDSSNDSVRDPADKEIDFENIDYDLLGRLLIEETNNARKGHNSSLSELTHSDLLARAAKMHCLDMLNHGFRGHESPVPGRRTLRDRIGGGVKFPIGENLVYNLPAIRLGQGEGYRHGDGKFYYSDGGAEIPMRTYREVARFAVKMWKDSPSHWSNIIKQRYNRSGMYLCSYRNNSMPLFHGVQVFSSGTND